MARKQKAKVIQDADGILPTAERGQHNEIATIETRKAGQRVRKVVDGTSLDYYKRHGIITEEQYFAGMRLYSLWRAAGWEQRLTSTWDSLPSGNADSSGSERAAMAIADLHILAREMGAQLYGMAEQICCHSLMATEWTEKSGYKKRAAPDLMRLSLDALIDAFKRLNQA
jgi:hypothetical protein